MTNSSERINYLPTRILDARIPWATLLPDKFNYSPCPLCGSFNYQCKASLVINCAEFFIVQCPACKLTWRNPMPDSGFLKELYSEKYFDVRKYTPTLMDQIGIPDATESDRLKRQDRTEQEVRGWMQRGIHPVGVDGKPKKLLEIGGGRGYLQRAAQDVGWETLGLEISPHGIKEAIERKLSIIPIVLDELCDFYLPYPKYFDIIVFFDFLEHIMDPCRVIRLVRSILKDNGVIILRVPCIEPDDIPRYHLIDHIYHFSDRTLRTVLEREGFEIVDFHPSGRFPGENGQIQNITYYCRKCG